MIQIIFEIFFFRTQKIFVHLILLQKSQMQQKFPHVHFNIKSLESLIEMLKMDKNYKDALKYGTNNYSINPYKINKMKLQEIFELANLIQVNYINVDRQSGQVVQKRKYAWLANQLKLFIWMAVCHSYIKNKPLQNYQEEDWDFFTKIFTRKTTQDLQFQAKSIFKNFHGNKQKWDEQQQNFLRQIINDQKYQNKWNDISRMLYFNSEKKYYRSSQKCRQHWFNHLDPRLNKNPWGIDQDIGLIKELQASGFKWSKITQLIEQKQGYRRTEHMIKNRAKLLFKKYGYRDEKEQSGAKQLKMIQRKLNQEKIRGQRIHMNARQQYEKLDKPMDVVQLKSSQKKKETYLTSSQKHLQQIPQQNKTSNNWFENCSQSESSQSSEEEIVPKIKKISKLQSIQQKSNNKRNVIILYHAQNMENDQAGQNQGIEQQESPQIMIGQTVQQNNEGGSQNQERKEQSYYDEYQIIEQVQNQELDLNSEMKFNHDVHGGRMRERVTHELAQFFNNPTKEFEADRNA